LTYRSEPNFSGKSVSAPAESVEQSGAQTMSLGPMLPWQRLELVALLGTLILGTADHAQARGSRHSLDQGPNRSPPYADIVVDDNSGQVLHQVKPDEPRHPASLTKIMTLYLLFEQLDAGALKLDTPLPVSAKASLQPPTKLSLKVNQTITVDDAIGGIVTRSANDAAVVVAEAIGGNEEEFAKFMTQKARTLGMTNTTYVNASGLPAEEQITTARDQAILGRAIHDRFPSYYRYFSTLSFRYHGVDIHNHNSLLGHVEGVDGIKTGYTEASGYNLASSVHRSDKHIVAVVLGETSNSARDARMRLLIEEYIRQASTQRTTERTLPISVDAPVRDDTKVDAASTTVESAPGAAAGKSAIKDNFEK
jgi:D-alanyl-D-alanine carboxypeptidase